MTAPDEQDVAKVVTLIPPTAATDNGWNEAKIINVMTDNDFGVAQTVRFYWLERVNETVEYINIGDKALLQLHQNARAMLTYWDAVIASGSDLGSRAAISFGTIERPVRR